MTVAENTPTIVFRPSMLLTDSRYRSVTYQIIVLVLVFVVVGFLVRNAAINLNALGKDLGFGFLADPAGYDINQRLIDYNSQSPHWRAAIVGILNTLLVAFLGCIAATILGVTAGVLRLSSNWIVAKLMAVYVEFTRNVPVLLQILLWFGVFIETFPSPRQAEASLGGLILFTNRGWYIPAPIAGEGFGYVIIAFVLAIISIIYFRRWARTKQDETGQSYPVFLISLGILVAPALIVFLVLGSPLSWEFPTLQGFNFQGGIFARNSLLALWFALSLYTGAFIAENVRAGILSVSRGQTEAAYALGLRPGRTMQLIILPQAMRVIVPPLISQFLNLTKNSSLAIAVGYMDATGTLGGITLNQTGREMETIMLLMLFYLIVSLSISGAMNVYNSRVKMRER
ncbi:MAG: amino acid ABC transporter permease [Alphaproteobacteria bacterium]